MTVKRVNKFRKMRKKKRQSPKKKETTELLSKEERNKAMMYRFAQTRNAVQVGEEFGVSRMYVKRAWDKLSEEEKNTLLDTEQQISEELNQKIIDAERISGDAFVRKIVEARMLGAEELLRRFKEQDIRMIPNKDFTSMMRMLLTVTGIEDKEDTEEKERQSTQRSRRESIREQIENQLKSIGNE